MATKVEAMSISIRKCSVVFFSVYRILAKINTGRLSFNVRNFSGFFSCVWMYVYVVFMHREECQTYFNFNGCYEVFGISYRTLYY